MFMTLLLRIDIFVFVARLFEPLSQCRNYFPEPIKVQNAQRRIADNVRHSEPRRYRQASRRLERSPDVLIHPNALIGAPNQSTSPERRDERDAIDELCRRASHVELIHKPMNVEKRRRQLVENEVQAVIIAKWPLSAGQLFTPRFLIIRPPISTHESQQRHRQRAHRMHQCAWPMHVQIPRTGHQIPQKIPGRKSLHHTAGARVAPNPLSRPHRPALLVQVYHSQRGRVYAT